MGHGLRSKLQNGFFLQYRYFLLFVSDIHELLLYQIFLRLIQRLKLSAVACSFSFTGALDAAHCVFIWLGYVLEHLPLIIYHDISPLSVFPSNLIVQCVNCRFARVRYTSKHCISFPHAPSISSTLLFVGRPGLRYSCHRLCNLSLWAVSANYETNLPLWAASVRKAYWMFCSCARLC